MLLDAKRVQIHYLTALFYYEPCVTSTKRFPQLHFRRVKKSFLENYFSGQTIAWFPKVIVLQSRVPVYGLQKAFLRFFYSLVCAPFVKGLKPAKILDVYGSKEFPSFASTIKIKELFLSLAFATQGSPKFPLIEIFFFHKYRFSAEIALFKGVYLEQDMATFLDTFASNESRKALFVQLFLAIISEQRIIIVCSYPGALMNLIELCIFPLSTNQKNRSRKNFESSHRKSANVLAISLPFCYDMLLPSEQGVHRYLHS